ncbi:DNA/RNA non-specific endonuclease [Croceivirga thetidis]|uniref:Endonuclease n=1 Tax=Croceivirga thetidis TaxID=2721623 RepID=A0ABX1GP36_9FLAO|nr:DNA/RNA non-specific endonuclease [Croceivirga thetidis]NKI31696.1 DNA/RNA non-specific endonuclease [Croceivirga thetidis]
MKRKTVYSILLITCIVGFWLFENFYTPDTYSDEALGNEIAQNDEYFPSTTRGVIIKHNFYSLSYSEPHEQAEWVYYELKKSHLTNDDRRRPYFIEDPKVPSKSADWRNYKNSGFDRGHLCPAGDRRFSEQAYNETFYTSNISPQKKDFNAGVWNRLEQQVRYWCRRHGDLTVITGGVLTDSLKEIGSEDVDVPEHYYKIIFRGVGQDLKALCFLVPHEESARSLEHFLVPIDKLEQLTGIDFFERLPKTIQSHLERNVNSEGWKF